MHLIAFLVGGLAGGFVGWVLALVLSRLVPEPPQRRPTLLGWATLAAGLASVGALVVALASGALAGRLGVGAIDRDALLADPVAWSAGLAAAGLFGGFMGAGRVADRHWPTGAGLLLSGGVVVAWLMLLLSRVTDLLLPPG